MVGSMAVRMTIDCSARTGRLYLVVSQAGRVTKTVDGLTSRVLSLSPSKRTSRILGLTCLERLRWQ